MRGLSQGRCVPDASGTGHFDYVNRHPVGELVKITSQLPTNRELLPLMDASTFFDMRKRLEAEGGLTFNLTVGACQSGRTGQPVDFDGLGSKENSPGMLGTNLSRLESIFPLKSSP
jgi:hypothetical protein